jgi:hypothetical protein
VSRRGQAEGIEHGTPEGARQHTSRGVLPVCGPCASAIAVEREGDARTANTGMSARFNVGTIGRQRHKKSGGGTVGARQVSAPRELAGWERRRAARLLAAAADDEADLAQLLDAVGLTANDGKATVDAPFLTTTSSTRGGC